MAKTDGLRKLLEASSWDDALSSPRVLRRRLMLAEVLARPVSMREDVRDLRIRAGDGPGAPR